VQRFLCRGFFLTLSRLHVVFHGVDVDVVEFGCFSTLIVATSGGNGLQQQQQQLFCAVDLSWFFIMRLFAWFLKSHRRRSAAASNNRARQQTQKTFAKTLQILLRKKRPAYTIASNNR
jgi:hypothetical protein